MTSVTTVQNYWPIRGVHMCLFSSDGGTGIPENRYERGKMKERKVFTLHLGKDEVR